MLIFYLGGCGFGGSLGFHDGGQQSSYDIMQKKVRDEIERAFNPEFLNRVDETIVFHTLDREEIGQIVHILMKEIDERLADEELSLTLSEAATRFLVEKGYDEKFGARPLRRAIQRYVEDPLSEKILIAEFSAGDEIVVDVSEDGEGLTMAVASQSKT